MTKQEELNKLDEEYRINRTRLEQEVLNEQGQEKLKAYREFAREYSGDMIDKLISRMDFKYMTNGALLGIDIDKPFGNTESNDEERSGRYSNNRYIEEDIKEILGLCYDYEFEDYEFGFIFEMIAKRINEVLHNLDK